MGASVPLDLLGISHRPAGIGFTQEMIRPTSMALLFAAPDGENRT